MGKFQDLTGLKFNRLTVLYRSPSRNGKTYWHCKCDCGKELDVWAPDLKSGHTKSCGCYKNEVSIKNIIKKDYAIDERLQHIGEHFGKLTIIDITNEKNSSGKYLYKCKCDCGSSIIKLVDYTSLSSGHTSSCGCLISKGEYLIERILQQNNIPYEKQKIFSDLPRKRFDFFVNNQYVIEYDGKQHFISYDSGWNSFENMKLTQERDKEKNLFCKRNNIPIIRIPYTHYDNICLEDLLLNTTTFLI